MESRSEGLIKIFKNFLILRNTELAMLWILGTLVEL
jgi:hypothetical protein